MSTTLSMAVRALAGEHDAAIAALRDRLEGGNTAAAPISNSCALRFVVPTSVLRAPHRR